MTFDRPGGCVGAAAGLPCLGRCRGKARIMLIFHKFPNRAAAVDFAAEVESIIGRKASIFDDARQAAKVALFPYAITPPVVLVDRFDDNSGEDTVIELGEQFGGTFAGA